MKGMWTAGQTVHPLKAAISILTPVAMMLLACIRTEAQRAHQTENVILFMTDGLRWQEVFRGAEDSLMTKEAGSVSNPEALARRYGQVKPEQRRAALMPFLWDVIARQGQLYGNRDTGSDAHVTNGKNFSYPGYSETLCGFPDARIDSNDKKPNPNRTVFEWFAQHEGFRGRVAAFGSWDVFPFIFNQERAGFPVNSGEPVTQGRISTEQRLLNDLKVETPRRWEEEPYDSFTFHSALEYLKANRPRVLFIGLGETDELAHEGKYEEYLDAAHRVDSYLRTLWQTLQSIPQYRGKTTLIVTTDHGRGNAPVEWKSHGSAYKGSENIWIAVLGPDTPVLGERRNAAPVTQSQIAATMAASLGLNYIAAAIQAAQPLLEALKKSP